MDETSVLCSMDENLCGGHKTFPCLFCFIYLEFLQSITIYSRVIGLARLEWSRNMIAWEKYLLSWRRSRGSIEKILNHHNVIFSVFWSTWQLSLVWGFWLVSFLPIPSLIAFFPQLAHMKYSGFHDWVEMAV